LQKIGDIGLKDMIQSTLGCYFALIDEPRKLGYVVSQFLHRKEFYKEHFITKYLPKGAGNAKEAERGRTSVSAAEKQLFSGPFKTQKNTISIPNIFQPFLVILAETLLRPIQQRIERNLARRQFWKTNFWTI
jgi:hypothetical protein